MFRFYAYNCSIVFFLINKQNLNVRIKSSYKRDIDLCEPSWCLGFLLKKCIVSKSPYLKQDKLKNVS